MKALIPVAFETQDEEFTFPYYRLQEENFEIDVAIPSTSNKPCIGKYGLKFPTNSETKECVGKDYDLIIIPGGWGAEILRIDKHLLEIVQQHDQKNITIGFICHGPWVGISAGILKGKQATCYPGMKDDLVNAGGVYLEQPVVKDGNLITSPHYKYNGIFMKTVLDKFYGKIH